MRNQFTKLSRQAVIMTACLFSFMLFWIFSIPIARYFYRTIPLTLRLTLIALMATAFLTFGSVFSLWFCLVPILALETYCATKLTWVKKAKSNEKAIFAAKLLLMILVHIAIGFTLKALFSEFWDAETGLWIEKIKEYLKSSKSFESITDEHVTALLSYLPAFYFGGFISAYLLGHWNTWALNKIEIPYFFFWLLLTSFCVGFINLKDLGEVPESIILIAKNIVFAICPMYFFQGVAVLNGVFDKIKIARFWRNLWYILIILYLPVGLVFVGIADFLFDYREPRKHKPSDSNKTIS